MALLDLTDSSLTEQIEKIAKAEGQSSKDVVSEAVRRHIAAYRQKRIQTESDAWYNMAEDVRGRFTGKFVAILDGSVVDEDVEQITLLKRVRKTYGKEPVLIIEGGSQPMPTYKVSSVQKA